jgi:hypothetical protein
MPVLGGVVDQSDVPTVEGIIEVAVLGRRHHPAAVHGFDWFHLRVRSSDDNRRVIVTDQGVVIIVAHRNLDFDERKSRHAEVSLFLRV